MTGTAIAYNRHMSLTNRSTARQLLVHWLVLLSLVLGQAAMSATLVFAELGQGQGRSEAKTQAQTQTKVPVCTSTGIIYVSWPHVSSSNDEQPTPLAATHAGYCVWCTVAPHQLRLDLQRQVLVAVAATDVAGYAPLDAFVTPAFTGNPHAPPRAPPLV